jgi:hypothetical protein
VSLSQKEVGKKGKDKGTNNIFASQKSNFEPKGMKKAQFFLMNRENIYFFR